MTNATANNLEGLVSTLEIQAATKQDLVLSPQGLRIGTDGILTVKHDFHEMRFDPNEICHEQIAGKLSIPVQYYKRMLREDRTMLAHNVNGWLRKEEKAKYLLRTFNTSDTGIARAFLSDRYNALDNYDVLLASLEAIKKTGVKVEITKAIVSDRRMYLHVTCPEVELQAEAFLKEYLRENNGVGNGIISGFIISNSETGHGKFSISPRAVVVKCNNGLLMKDDSFSSLHLGGQLEEGFITWSEATRQKNYELIISQTQDAVKQFLSEEYLGRMIQRIAEAHSIRLEHPTDTVQHVCKELSITEDHKKSILDFFLRDGDHNASGVFHALTRGAQGMDADEQYRIEGAASSLLPKLKSFDRPFSKN